MMEKDFKTHLALKLNTIGYILSDLQYQNDQRYSCDVSEPLNIVYEPIYMD